MGETGPVMVSARREEDLRLVFEPPECLAVDDPVPVPLKAGAYLTLLFRHCAAPAS
jgi:hypothetical protein